MSETAGFGMVLSASIVRRQAVEDAREAKQEREERQEREMHREQLHEAALVAYRSAAESRGEYVSAVALATGQGGGRTLADIFAGAEAAADQQDARAGAAERNGRDDWGYVGRSNWPGSQFELERELGRAEDLHRDFVAYRARTGYQDAESVARAKSDARGQISR